MTETDYIEQVKSNLNDTTDRAKSVAKIYKLELPNNANPLLVLIHGDSGELADAVSYAREHDPANPSDEEIEELSNNIVEEVITKLKQYLRDWDSQNAYHYSFQLKASYGAFTNSQGDTEYIDVIKRIADVKTVKEAVRAARVWERQLLERIVFYIETETSHKRISVKPTYTIRDSHLAKIASGTLQSDDEFGISTWLNQD